MQRSQLLVRPLKSYQLLALFSCFGACFGGGQKKKVTFAPGTKQEDGPRNPELQNTMYQVENSSTKPRQQSADSNKARADARMARIKAGFKAGTIVVVDDNFPD